MIGLEHRLSGSKYVHGHMRNGVGTKTYVAWHGMRRRCFDPNNPKYPVYGGRGITVCDRWSEFSVFLADMGECPNGKTLDRIDVNGNYEPSNCRWATPEEQQNNRRDNVFITHLGETLTIAQWSRKTGLAHETIRRRFLRGAPTDQIMEPAHKPKTHCPHGHVLDEANTALKKGGYRVCRICHRAANAALKLRRKAIEAKDK